jgi:alpha 1,3-glucosidase
MRLILALLMAVMLSAVSAVERHKFKTCSQSSFCGRNRHGPHGPFHVVTGTVDTTHFQSKGQITAKLHNQKFPKQKNLDLIVNFLQNDVLRVRVTELNAKHKRFELTEILEPHALDASGNLGKCDSKEDFLVCSYGGSKEVKILFEPFRLRYFVDGKLQVALNDQDLLNFEPYRDPNPAPPPPPEPQKDENGTIIEPQTPPPPPDPSVNELEYPFDSTGSWEESYSSHTDSKPRGPASFGMDIKFSGSSHVYGLPEHATKFSLPDTKSTDPYRLYNLDVFKYELDEPMALYGSIPFAISHKEGTTNGVYWNNAAETFIDVFDSPDASRPGKTLHFFSESGVLDLFILAGPTPAKLYQQYNSLTGTPALPQKFAVAYHQCRWNYKDENDVKNVDASFDEHGIPYDVLWLDIEHTDGKRYFTWDKSNFPTPKVMQKNLADKGRKMVTIVDPHIKRDSGWNFYSDAQSKGFFVKNKDGNDFDGWCWPGSSGYLDFFKPEVRDYWAKKFNFDSYDESTPTLYTWNDMNEPSVFNGPEVTMHKDCLHRGDIEHRDVHNLYGYYVHQSTFEGHLVRSKNTDRPFVLSRAFFAGSQRWGAVWTGDNTAQWSHLAYSVPMLLSMGTAGLPFVGADVGGFFDNPDTELLVRWYQAGVYQPFFRAHAHIETNRREPWLFGEENTALIREAVLERYAHLPYIYTAFWNNTVTGIPVMRPLWMEFPNDKKTFPIDDQHLLGSGLLIKPVVTKDCQSVDVYLPGSHPWYDVKTWHSFPGGASVTFPTPKDRIPVLQRGGTIIPKQERKRRSSFQMTHDPYTLQIALDSNVSFISFSGENSEFISGIC